MGCGASSLRGDDVPSINATAKPSYMRAMSSHNPPTEHYATPLEREAELQRVESSQPRRRPSRAAYVDPDDLPMPPKTTHQHYHRRQSDNAPEKDAPARGWDVREMVKMPARARGGQRREVDSGVVVPNNARHQSFIG
jgi:hypothetical protein